MKKFVALCAALVLLFCMSAAVSAEAASDGVTVYVTLSDGAGHLVMARQPVAVTDLDADGSVTVNDALIAAHDEAYTGGSEAGYASVAGEYGLSITRLWGIENGGSYGYYVNNAMAMSLQDPVADGDRVSAYVYADLTAWSDMYCWFEPETASLKQGETVTLTLSGAGFDADWNPVTLPVEGAELTVNGERTGLTTDADGKVVYTADKSGTLTLSAVSDSQVLVPPVCVAEVAAARMSAVWYIVIAVVLVAVIAVAVVLIVRKKK